MQEWIDFLAASRYHKIVEGFHDAVKALFLSLSGYSFFTYGFLPLQK